MTLKAHAKGSRIAVWGQAARTSDYYAVKIALYDSTVSDNDPATSDVAIGGSHGALTVVNARFVKGAGVEVYCDEGDDVAQLSDQNDYFSGYFGDDWVAGYKGDDRLDGGEGNDTLIGLQGADRLGGGAGNDTLDGGAGSDLVDGGFGEDVALYRGNRGDYDVRIENGVYVVEDLRAGAPDGTDYVGNVESLRFADEDVALTESPSRIKVHANGSKLSVWGTAAGRDPLNSVFISFQEGVVEDNGVVRVQVPIDGSFTEITSLNARAIKGFGVTVLAGEGDDVAQLSDYNDYCYGFAGNDRLVGFGGDDWLIGAEDNDTLIGLQGRDTLDGGSGNDALDGGAGDDILKGGEGSDIAIYRGNSADYDIRMDGGALLVTDLRAGSPDGADWLSDIETLRFADGDVAAPNHSAAQDIDLSILQTPDLLL